MKVTIYQKPTCTTCRQVHAALVAAGVDLESVNYYTDPLSAAELKRLVRKIGCPAREILRTKEPAYKELGLSGKDLTDDELIALMAEHPDLLQRPIVERGSRAILARPADRIKDFLA
jgi:arsenate reductase